MNSTIQVAKRGVVTLPKHLRDRYSIQEGDAFTLIDMDGTFLLRAGRSELDALADKMTHALQRKGESLDSMLAILREERETYGRKRPPVS